MKKYVNFKFIVVLLVASIGVFCSQFINNTVFNDLESKRVAVISGISLACVLWLWNFSEKFITRYCIILVCVFSTVILKMCLGCSISAAETMDTVASSILLLNAILCFIYLNKELPVVGKAKTIVKWLGNAALFLYLFIPCTFMAYYFISGEFLTTDIVLTIFQTNMRESYAYFHDHISLISRVSIVLLLFLLMFLVRGFSILEVGKKVKPIKKYLLVVAAVCWCLVNGISIAQASIYYSIGHEVADALVSYKDYNAVRVERINNLKKISGENLGGRDGIYLLIIGESETRDHMQAYGYARQNTPWLDKEKANKNFILFKNAYSCHTHTVPVLTYALTEKNQYNKIELKKAVSIIEIAKVAGFNTIWISNQERFGAWDTPVAGIASTADKAIWVNGHAGRVTRTNFYDEELLKRLRELKLNKRTLIVLHLMGSHGSYGDRFPANFKKYSGKNLAIDNYDNSIYYTDSVLESIYDYISQQANFKAMAYFSDHGEDVENNNSHEASKFAPIMSRIPFFLVVSPDYANGSGKQIITNLKNHENSIFTNDLIYDFMCGVMGIKVRDKKEAFTSDQYDTHRDFKTLHGTKDIIR